MDERDIAVFLLKHGADPQEKYLCTPSLGKEEL
jgi:hypothetical protein